jgi:hypothetical protein
MMRLRLRVVLVEPRYEGNVGSVAGAMKNLASIFSRCCAIMKVCLRGGVNTTANVPMSCQYMKLRT